MRRVYIVCTRDAYDTARVKMSDRTNQVLNIVKAKYNLKDKSAALDLVVAQYEEKILEPRYSPEFIKEMLEFGE